MVGAETDSKRACQWRFGTRPGWFLAAFLTSIGLFLYSGAMCHTADPPAHPAVGTLGWLIAGLSPAMAYISYCQLGKGFRHGTLPGFIGALAILLLCQGLGVAMIMYALAGQPLRIG